MISSQRLNTPEPMVAHLGGMQGQDLIDGQVVGTWKRTVKKNVIANDATPFNKLRQVEVSAFKQAAGHYGAFIGSHTEVL
jgi:hypothetical protein